MKLLKSIFGTIVGLIIFAIVQGIVYAVISLLGQIPILRNILYYPSDSSWALTVLPPIAGVQAAAMIAMKIGGSAKPVGVIIAGLYMFNIICMFALHNFTWQELWMSLFTIGSALFAFFEVKEESQNKREKDS